MYESQNSSGHEIKESIDLEDVIDHEWKQNHLEMFFRCLNLCHDCVPMHTYELNEV